MNRENAINNLLQLQACARASSLCDKCCDACYMNLSQEEKLTTLSYVIEKLRRIR